MSYYYIFSKEECWYKDHCTKFPEECKFGCTRHLEMHYLMSHSNLPKVKQYPVPLKPSKEDMSAFKKLLKIKNDIKEWVKSGGSLYICSESFGNGKTTWAIKLLLKYFDEIWAGNGFKTKGIFIHVPTLLTQIKSNISNRNKDFEIMLEQLSTADLVVWDDIAATKLSDYDHTNLLTLVDQRLLSCLANIYTGNLVTEEAINNALGKRLSSRIYSFENTIEFTGSDRRGQNGNLTNY